MFESFAASDSGWLTDEIVHQEHLQVGLQPQIAHSLVVHVCGALNMPAETNLTLLAALLHSYVSLLAILEVPFEL